MSMSSPDVGPSHMPTSEPGTPGGALGTFPNLSHAETDAESGAAAAAVTDDTVASDGTGFFPSE